MSKLYLKAFSDARSNNITSRGHNEISATIYYGSKHDSKPAGSMKVYYNKEKKKFYLNLWNDENTNVLSKELPFFI